MTRREWADELCRRLHAHVARETPAELGHWEPAWQIIDAPSKELLDVLHEYEQTGHRAAKELCVRLAGEVLNAWRSAAAEWERAGRPLPHSTPAPELTTV